MMHNQSRDTAYLVCTKTAIGHECYWLQPELGHGPLPLHMDMRRFSAVGTEEDEIVRSLTKYGRHRAIFPRAVIAPQEERFYAEKSKVATEAEHFAALHAHCWDTYYGGET
jgi:hypothetical protein